jgi:hypothetical protein
MVDPGGIIAGMSDLVSLAVIIGGGIALLELVRRLVKAAFQLVTEQIETRKAVKAATDKIIDLGHKVDALERRVSEVEWTVRRALGR